MIASAVITKNKFTRQHFKFSTNVLLHHISYTHLRYCFLAGVLASSCPVHTCRIFAPENGFHTPFLFLGIVQTHDIIFAPSIIQRQSFNLIIKLSTALI